MTAEQNKPAPDPAMHDGTLEPREESAPSGGLPFSGWMPFIAGALSGLALRLMFSGKPGSALSAMAAGFVWFAPFAVGAVTVYVAERHKRRSFSYYLFAPALATFVFVLGSLAILIEGVICAIVILPLFTAVGMLGGVVMGLVCRMTDWPRQAVYSIAALPLLVAIAFPQNQVPRMGSVERSVLIQATPAEVWRQINDARAIRPAEVQHAWAYRIGVPLPVSGITTNTAEGPIRKSTWGKGVHFDEVIRQWEPQRHVRWTYRFAEDSFPAGALDDHVKVGGAYFDLRDTAYTLTPEEGGTRLHIRVSYRISTDFDAYANWVAQGLLGNFSEVILDMYKARSEHTGNAALS
jgi:hypothetical protein